jgi:hypothetical protein
MIEGKVTVFAKKRFEQGDKNVAQYLAQINAQVDTDLKHKIMGKEKAVQKAATNAKNLVNNKQTSTKEENLKNQLHESV